MTQLETGLSGELRHRVVRGDTAAEWGNEIEVLSTPVLLWLGEMACIKALEGHLPPGEMTLGAAHETGHLAPTPEGFWVTVRATLVKVEGRRLTFQVEAHDGVDSVMEGLHVRYRVARDRFVDRVRQKAAQRDSAQEVGPCQT